MSGRDGYGGEVESVDEDRHARLGDNLLLCIAAMVCTTRNRNGARLLISPGVGVLKSGQQGGTAMKRVMCTMAVVLAATLASVSVAPVDAFAASRHSAYDAKKAACKERASRKNFGIHLIKRNRWIKECIAGAA
jgi:hypothetical protein